MIKLALATICDSATVDLQTNQISLFKIIESVNYNGQFPLIIPRITLVMFCDKEGDNISQIETATLRISLSPANPNNAHITTNNMNIEIPANKRRARLITELGGYPINAYGINSIIIKMKVASSWNKIGEVSFDVTNNPTPESVGSIPI